MIGVNCVDVRECAEASAAGAELIFLGPVYGRVEGLRLQKNEVEKPEFKIIPVAEVGRAAKEAKAPVYVHGDISRFKYNELRATGVKHLLLTGAIKPAPNVAKTVERAVKDWGAA